MKKEVKQMLDSPDWCTLRRAVELVGIHPITFRKYAARLGIEGVAISKYTFFRRPDVDRIAQVAATHTPVWISMIERETGRKVKEIIFDD
jgi:hypothetical protein